MIHASRRIRELLRSESLTALELHSRMAEYSISIASLRGTIHSMLRVGILTKIGTRPYKYTIGEREPRCYREPEKRKKKLSKSNVSQLIRDQLKIKQMAPAEIANALEITTERAYQCMRDMVKSGHIAKMGDGTYTFLREPKKPMTPEEAREKKNAARRVANGGQRRYAPKPKTFVQPKAKPAEYTGPKQSIDDWLKAGGVIDRSPTALKFERLTEADIANGRYRQRIVVNVNAGRSYLTA